MLSVTPTLRYQLWTTHHDLVAVNVQQVSPPDERPLSVTLIVLICPQ